MTSSPVQLENEAVPPLEQGARLTRAEFERRFDSMPHVKKAELIDGVVYMASPVRFEKHGRPHGRIVTWLGNDETFTPGVVMADDPTTRLDDDNAPQPDAVLMIDPALGGRSRISDDDYIEGAPELVVEVAASSLSLDVNGKLRAYRRAGVLEYLVWRILDGSIDWLHLAEDGYRALKPDDRGILRSVVFPGLWLDMRALLGRDHVQLDETLRHGLATPDHAAFVARLEEARRGWPGGS